jgi:hypothetical protein
MRTYSLSHIRDFELSQGLAALVARDRATTAMLLAHIAEFDARRLYLPAAYPSMYAYCVHELHLSEDAAYKRIRVARAARKFPAIFEAVAAGRLQLSGVVLLAPHLTLENADELLTEGSHKTKAEIEELLANRFPRSEATGLVEALPGSATPPNPQLAPGPVGSASPDRLPPDADQLAVRQVEARDSERPGEALQLAPARVGPRAKVTPIAPDRFLLQLTIGCATRDKLQHAQNLLGHQLPSGDVAQVLERALDALLEKLERRKFAAAKRPRGTRRRSERARHIPAYVKRAVWERDGGQCTYRSESGRRCDARKILEFDHLEPVARGGRASAAGIRLRCRAHNQYDAERAFGAEFMRGKRDTAQRAATLRRAAEARARAAAEELIAPLRILGFSADEARRAAARCHDIPDASLELRVRRALSCFGPHHKSAAPAAGCGASAP